MARIRPKSIDGLSRSGPARFDTLLLALVVLVCVRPTGAGAREPLRDGPVVWYAADDRPIPRPEFAEPRLISYTADSFLGRPFSRFWHPGRFLRRLGTGDAARPASDINALDEVVSSTWFTNRIGLRPLSTTELCLGAAAGQPFADGPDRSRPWTIVGAKTAGVTPGFRIEDGRGDTWLLKFDPPRHPGMTIRAGVVSNLIFHAIGFNTPVDQLVVFDRRDLEVGDGARMKVGRDGTAPLTAANLDSILTATGSIFDGRYHALASRYLDGVSLGPFDDEGLRTDDPNDQVKHENRRELRALRVFGAWLNHFDTKMQNSLDMYVGAPGQGHVRHYLIDFASTLGGYADRPVKRFGYEYGLDVWPIAGRLLSFGLVEDPWVELERPAGLAEVGLFDVATFEPGKWKPDLPHSGMASLTRRDGYWAAKIISAFTRDDLRLIVEQARYHDPAAAAYLVEALVGRRDRIARYWFDQVPPLDYFSWREDTITFADLAVARGYTPADGTRYRYRLAVADRERNGRDRTAWRECPAAAIPLDRQWRHPRSDGEIRFLTVEVQLDRGRGWTPSTTAYFSLASKLPVAVDR